MRSVTLFAAVTAAEERAFFEELKSVQQKSGGQLRTVRKLSQVNETLKSEV